MSEISPARRVAIIRISAECVLEMTHIGCGVDCGAVPEGAKFERSYYDGIKGLHCFVISHPDFELVKAGDAIPFIPPKAMVKR